MNRSANVGIGRVCFILAKAFSFTPLPPKRLRTARYKEEHVTSGELAGSPAGTGASRPMRKRNGARCLPGVGRLRSMRSEPGCSGGLKSLWCSNEGCACGSVGWTFVRRRRRSSIARMMIGGVSIRTRSPVFSGPRLGHGDQKVARGNTSSTSARQSRTRR